MSRVARCGLNVQGGSLQLRQTGRLVLVKNSYKLL